MSDNDQNLRNTYTATGAVVEDIIVSAPKDIHGISAMSNTARIFVKSGSIVTETAIVRRAVKDGKK